jgi:hypothetical protein
VNIGGDGTGALRGMLDATYWIVAAGFLAIVVAFSFDRACSDHLNLLPAAARRPALAWPIAVVYLSGYGWIALAYCAIVGQTGSLLPRPGAARAVWPEYITKTILMIAIAALDLTPPAVLSAIGRFAGVCRA